MFINCTSCSHFMRSLKLFFWWFSHCSPGSVVISFKMTLLNVMIVPDTLQRNDPNQTTVAITMHELHEVMHNRSASVSAKYEWDSMEMKGQSLLTHYCVRNHVFGYCVTPCSKIYCFSEINTILVNFVDRKKGDHMQKEPVRLVYRRRWRT